MRTATYIKDILRYNLLGVWPPHFYLSWVIVFGFDTRWLVHDLLWFLFTMSDCSWFLHTLIGAWPLVSQWVIVIGFDTRWLLHAFFWFLLTMSDCYWFLHKVIGAWLLVISIHHEWLLLVSIQGVWCSPVWQSESENIIYHKWYGWLHV